MYKIFSNLAVLSFLLLLTLVIFKPAKVEQVELKVIDIAIDTKNWK